MHKGKIVLITGGTKGIGKALVFYFLRKGATVNTVYSSDERAAQKLKEEAAVDNYCVDMYKAGVGDKKRIDDVVKSILEKYGRIDVLVNNAGIVRDQFLLMMKPEDWRDVLNTNLDGVFNCCKSVIPSMLENRSGKIINISSTGGMMGKPGQVNYAASKAGIIGFSKALARELAPHNINVNVVAPGFIATEMVEKMNPRAREEFLKQIPLRRLGEPEEVANVVGFLASEEASYLVGAVLVVDGGLIC